MSAPDFEAAYAKALHALRYGDKFAAEVRAALERGDFSPEAIDETLARLSDKRILDDQRVIQQAIQRSKGKKAKGTERLRQELLKRGAPEELLEAELATIENESGQIQQLLAAKFKPGDPPAKAARFLYSRGFSEESIESALENFFESS